MGQPDTDVVGSATFANSENLWSDATLLWFNLWTNLLYESGYSQSCDKIYQIFVIMAIDLGQQLSRPEALLSYFVI